jgi:hypothetical protein
MGGSFYGLRGAPSIPREWLEGSPFNDFKIPSVFLGIAVGGSSALSAATVAAQVAVIGLRSFLQPVFGGGGITMVVLGAKLRCDAEDDHRSPG